MTSLLVYLTYQNNLPYPEKGHSAQSPATACMSCLWTGRMFNFKHSLSCMLWWVYPYPASTSCETWKHFRDTRIGIKVCTRVAGVLHPNLFCLNLPAFDLCLGPCQPTKQLQWLRQMLFHWFVQWREDIINVIKQVSLAVGQVWDMMRVHSPLSFYRNCWFEVASLVSAPEHSITRADGASSTPPEHVQVQVSVSSRLIL